MGEQQSYEQIGPWQRVSTRAVYDNPWISIRHEDVITPAGTNGIYGVVHFKTRAIGIIPIDQDGLHLVGSTSFAAAQSALVGNSDGRRHIAGAAAGCCATRAARRNGIQCRRLARNHAPAYFKIGNG